MTERQGLLAKAERFLASARLLADSGDLDSAVSRLYYAAFYVAEALLDALEISCSSHRGVISAFGQEFAKKGRVDPCFHRLLITAFEKRQQADYWVKTGLQRKHNLKLYVISPRSPRDFKGALLDGRDQDSEDKKIKKILWKALAGYWDWDLKDVCPVQQPYFSKEIRKAIFLE